MTKLLDEKVVLIIGGSSGIGRATAVVCAREGARLMIASRREAETMETIEMAQRAGGEAFFCKVDVTDRKTIENLMETTIKTYSKIDCAINNSGRSCMISPSAEQTEDDWNQTLNVNLKGMWLCMQLQIKSMQQQGQGSIVNMSSLAGLVGLPGSCAYSASKHGIVGMSKTAALEYAASGIRINALCPGIIDTPLIDRVTNGCKEAKDSLAALPAMKRLGRAEEVAEAAAWLCSDRASYVTGHTLVIDGGLHAQ